MEVLEPEQVKDLMDEPWISPYKKITMCADEENNLIELIENHARGVCYGGAAWEMRHFQETGELVLEGRREGARNIFYLNEGRGDLDLVPGLAAAGIEKARIEEDELKVGYAGLAGAGVAVAMCRGLADGVKRVEVEERGGGGKLGKASIVTPKHKKITIGVDDTDTGEEGATWGLANEVGYKLDKIEGINYTNHTIVQLFTENPYRTQNGVGISISFAVKPSKEEKLRKEAKKMFNELTSSDDTAIAIYDKIKISEKIKDYSKQTKKQMMEVDEAEKVAEDTDVDLISITGEQGKIGALAAIGYSKDPDKAARVEK
ncbi:MAG: putative DNA-binding protein containing a Zn-ribbon domain [Candidatus Methanohalarchaeum thermophilum]|uniref:DNA-binding protein containing a Zn-ribbon domain n=1 Tax=Methanohalarchaeum thermophilum TaxID=1903181 RepID=A0A1Q6DVT6_METT1|nr:MAG: putative DNA-binding protein containing a Zn-ribbon domain [Candidatus Methanohalarchaeum thermophilum]